MRRVCHRKFIHQQSDRFGSIFFETAPLHQTAAARRQYTAVTDIPVRKTSAAVKNSPLEQLPLFLIQGNLCFHRLKFFFGHITEITFITQIPESRHGKACFKRRAAQCLVIRAC